VRQLLGAIGPGIIVAGSVIGSGELINTPVQAARFGFVLLWVILLSCVIKYFLQVEFARYCMVHNCTTFQALNQLPVRKIRGTAWPVLLYVFGYFFSLLTIVGIIGALGGLMHSMWPFGTTEVTSVRIWGALSVLLAIVLLWQGWYRQLETLVMVLVGGFSVCVGLGVLLVQGTEYRITTQDLLSGLSFSIGPDKKAAAFAVISLMGALGVAANELLMYPYWVLEKGYARELGDPSSPGWTERVRQWTRAIWLDAGLCTAISTIVTAAFFLLGAAVLYRQQKVPQGLAVVDQISSVFTESYGPWSKWMFRVGAFCTLFSTLVVVAAASGRMGADFLASIGAIDRDDGAVTRRCHQIVQTGCLLGLLVAFLSTSATPTGLIVTGHFVLGAFLTPLLMFCICWLAFHTNRRARMGRLTAAALVGSVAIILACVVVNVFLHVTGEEPGPVKSAQSTSAELE
jgi:Mn2+/Fe2+ NRAMP family transporter